MAIGQLTNNAEYTWYSDDIKDIQWITQGVTTPTQKQITDKIAEIKAHETAAKSAAIEKLEALGLTIEDLAVLR